MKSPTIEEVGMANEEVVDQEWMTPTWEYLKMEVYLKSQAAYVMDEIHRGIYGFYSRGHTMVYHCTPQTTTGENLFRLSFGTDVVILVEIGKPSTTRSNFNSKGSEDVIRVYLNLVEGAREQACIKQEACKQRKTRRYNTKVKPRDLRENDLVWRKTREARKRREDEKLAAN
ncbi:hypothetical protein CR513_03534, partial [Mucuna pruriens]